MESHKSHIPLKYFYRPIHNLVIGGVRIFDFHEPAQNWLHTLYSISLIGIFAYGCIVTEILYIVAHFDDLEQVTWTLCYLIAHIIGALKILLFIKRRKAIGRFLMSLERGVFMPDVNRGGQNEVLIIQEAIKRVNRQPIIFLIIVLSMLSSGLVRCTINRLHVKKLLRSRNGTETIITPFPYPSKLPFPAVDEQKSPNYEIICLYQSMCIALFGWHLGNCDTIITGIMIHLRAQFRVLNNAILTVVERAARMTYGGDDGKRGRDLIMYKKKFASNLRICIYDCVKHHMAILELFKNMEDTFTLLVLIQFLGFLSTICVGLYQCSLVPATSPLFVSMSAYTAAMLFQLLIYCWNGNEMTLESVKVATAAYDLKWYGGDRDAKMSLLLIMLRAQRPCVFTAAKFTDVSLVTFMTIVKSAFSFFMFLRKVNEDEQINAN